jgi:hypothetical protein
MLKGVPEIRIVTFAKTSVLGEGQEGIICRGGDECWLASSLNSPIISQSLSTRSLINIVQYSYHYSEISLQIYLQDQSTRSIYKIYLHVHIYKVSTSVPTTLQPTLHPLSASQQYAHMHTHIHISSRHRSSFFLLNCGSRPLSEVIFL